MFGPGTFIFGVVIPLAVVALVAVASLLVFVRQSAKSALQAV